MKNNMIFRIDIKFGKQYGGFDDFKMMITIYLNCIMYYRGNVFQV